MLDVERPVLFCLTLSGGLRQDCGLEQRGPAWMVYLEPKGWPEGCSCFFILTQTQIPSVSTQSISLRRLQGVAAQLHGCQSEDPPPSGMGWWMLQETKTLFMTS